MLTGRAWRDFEPAWVGEVDSDALPERIVTPGAGTARAYARARLLIRRGIEPLGLVELALDRGVAEAQTLAAAISEQVPDSEGDAVPAGHGPLPPFSVVVCTHERVASLRATIESVLAADQGALELLVVDSAPAGNATRELVESIGDSRLRYRREAIPGLSRARNLGIALAASELIAFTDDDVVVDRWWLRQLAVAFGRSPRVGAVTGLALAVELETPAQAYFEAAVGWSSRFAARVFDSEHRGAKALFPYAAGELGAGVNFAVRRATFGRVGQFDEALGAGTPARGGEDLDFLARVILAGETIAYEPSALVWHRHRRDISALRAQMFGYGSGLSAYAFKHLLHGGAVRALPGAARAALADRLTPAARVRVSSPRAPALRALELAGLACGPWLYRRGKSAAQGIKSAAG